MTLWSEEGEIVLEAFCPINIVLDKSAEARWVFR